MHLRRFLGFATLLATTACRPATVDEAGGTSAGKADTGGLAEGTPEATAVLRVANEATLAELDEEVGLSTQAAENIVAYRLGDDEEATTADDATFASLAELDAVPYVGPSAFAKLLAYAEAQGLLAVSRPATARQSLDGYACPSGNAAIPVAFFDADSTLRVAKSGAVTATGPRDVDVLPFVATGIADLNRTGVLVAIVSNQLGVSTGKISAKDAEAALAFTALQLGRLGARIDYLDFAEANDEYRKPKTGMATRLSERLEARCGRTFEVGSARMIGDSGYKMGVDGPHPDGRPADDFGNADRLFAENLGVPFAEPTDFFGWRAFEVYNVATESELGAFLAKIDAEVARLDEAGHVEDAARRDALLAEVAIGIGGSGSSAAPLPHHRTYGSVSGGSEG